MKKVYLTETQLRGVIHDTIHEEYSIFPKEVVERLLQEQSFFEDGRNPLSRVGDFFGGLKGMYKGEGFKYGEHSTALSRFLNRLKKLDAPNGEVMKHLDKLIDRIDKSSITQDRKDGLKAMIQDVQKEFKEYQAELDSTINKIKGGNIPSSPQPSTQPNTQPNPQPAPQSEYHLIVNGQTIGPHNLQQIEQWIQNGLVTRDIFVWKPGMTGWVEAGKVPELANLFTSPPPNP
jgi:hypothetical protein